MKIMNQNVISQFLIRIKSESPTLFKRLQWFFFTLTGIIIVLIFLQPLHLNLHGMEVYVNWNTVMVLLGFGGVALLPVKDDTVLIKKTKNLTSSWDELQDLTPYNEGLEPWMDGEEGGTWEWEGVNDNGLVGKRKKRKQ